MRKKWLGSNLFFTLGVLLLAAPIFLLSAGGRWEAVLPAVLACVLSLSLQLLPKRLRFPAVLCGIPLCVGTALMLPEPTVMLGICSGVFMAVMPYLLSRRDRSALNAAIWLIGIGVHILCHVLARLNNVPLLPGSMRTATYAYFLYLPFELAMLSLEDGVGSQKRPSLLMRGRSAAAAVIWVALFLALTHIDTLKQWLRAALDFIGRVLAWIGELLSRTQAGIPGGMGGGGFDFGGGEEAGEPSLFAVIMEKVALVLAALLAAAIVIFLVRAIVKTVSRGIRNLAARLRAYAGTVSEPYEDTVETLLDWGEVRRSWRDRGGSHRSRSARVPWDHLEPREKIRRSYQTYLRRHPDIPVSRTARQSLPDLEAAAIYETARYSSEPVSEADALRMRSIEKENPA